MQYKDLALLFLGVAGILLHSLVKISQLKKEGKEFNRTKYFGDEWPTMSISFIMVVVAIYCKHEIKELDIAGNYLGLGFVTLGYMGQSLLISFIGKAQKRAGIDDSAKALLVLVGSALLLSGCANEKHFVRFHDKHEAKALEHIVRWYPNRDSVREIFTYLPGKRDTLPGEIIYANCDSAYIAALDEAAKMGVKVVVKRVAVPCPPSTAIHDTLYRDKSVYTTNTKRERQLELQCRTATEGEQKAIATMRKWRKGAIVEGSILAVLVVGVAARYYFKPIKIA